MRLVEIIRCPTEVERADLVAFIDQVTATTGARPLSDHLWLDLRSTSEGILVTRIADATGVLAMAQISEANESSSLEIVTRPDVTDRQLLRDDLAETIVDSFRRQGGGHLLWWIDGPDDHDRSLVRRLGFEPARALYEMRMALPLDRRADVETRRFVPGVDDDAWIRVNNRAFSEHTEQGGWTRDTLAARITEPWFDPDGFRLHERDGRLAAFCWTKLHDEHDPTIGEIYVIAVDPDFHGVGLGTQLTLAGLDSIADRGVTMAMLYVDADNTPAVSMYERLGFVIHRSREAFAGTFGP